MDYLKVRNLRCLSEMSEVRIKPLTLLVGGNSSGKSSFLRCFPLFKQSVESRTNAPILFYGEYVDFGSYRDAFFTGIDNDTEGISFEFSFPFPSSLGFTDKGRSAPYWMELLRKRKSADVVIKTTVNSFSKNRKTFLHMFQLELYGHKVVLHFRPDGKVEYYSVNGRSRPCSGMFNGGASLIPSIVYHDEEFPGARRRLDYSVVQDGLVDILKSYSHSNTHRSRVFSLLREIHFSTRDNFLESVKYSSSAPPSLKRNLAVHYKMSGCVERILDWLLPSILYYLDSVFRSYANSVYYSSPFRATPDRYYRFQELEVQEIDPRGGNLAMFLSSLEAKDLSSFSSWTEEAFGFEVNIENAGGHTSVLLKRKGESSYHNIADIGFGFSQVLPIITQLWIMNGEFRSRGMRRFYPSSSAVFAMEQPEIHLHPKMVGDFVDALVKIINSRKGRLKRFVIETHSKAFIDRVGAHIASSNISSDDVNVVLFGVGGERKVRTTSYNDAGILENWPFDFFLAKRLGDGF